MARGTTHITRPGVLCYAGVILITLLFSEIYGGRRAQAKELHFTASVDRTVLERTETVTLTISAEGSVSSVPDPQLPDLSDFRVISGPNESSTFQIINGQYSFTKSWSFILKPERTGTLTIGAAQLHVKGRTYQTEPITLTVTTGSGTPVPNPHQPDKTPRRTVSKAPPELYVSVTADRQKIYQNEQVVLTYTIYTRVSVNSYEISRMPSTPGFWTEEFDIPDPPVVQDEVIGGRHYRKALIRKVALFPTRAGKLTVDPLEVRCEVQVQDQNRRRQDPFDRFFNSPFSRYRTVERFIETEPLTLNVLPLPKEGKPDNFSGAVGNFSLNVKLDRTQVKTNEALTMTARFSGTGNVKMLDEPDFKAPSDFESYAPKEVVKITKSGKHIFGTKTYEYVLIPRVPGKEHIPPITFSYFDPQSESYRTITKGGFDVEVQRGAGGTAVSLPGISKAEVKLLAEDISYLKTPGRLQSLSSPYLIPTKYWVAMALPPILALFLWWGARLLGAPTLRARRRSRLIYAQAKKELQAISKAADSSADAAEIYGSVHRVLLAYLGQKLNLPASGLKEQEVLTTLAEYQVSDDLLIDLREIFEECNQARFAPSGMDASRLQRVIRRSHRTLDTLEGKLNAPKAKTAGQFATALVLCALLCAGVKPGYTQPTPPDPSRAADLYRTGDYSGAAAVYEKIITQGWHNGEIYYNLGNCYYKLGEYGKAILNYERARRYLGHDAELKKNLELANLHIADRIEPLPQIFIIRILRGIAALLTVQQWAALFLISEWLLFLSAVGLYGIRRLVWRKLLVRGFVIFAIAAVVSGGFFLDQKLEKEHLTEGIVLSSTEDVRSAPEAGATGLFTLHEGAKVRVLRTVSGWAEIRLADGKQGWLPQSAFETI